MMANCLEYILAWFGSSLAGMAEVPINTAYRGGVLRAPGAHRRCERRRGRPRAGRAVRRVGRCLRHRASRLRGRPRRCRAETRPSPRWCAPDIRPSRSRRSWTAPPDALPEPRPQDLAAIFFTSGTTGLSKGVAMSHSQLYFFADEGVSLVRLTEDDVYLSVGPLFHGNAQFLAAYPAMIVGARFVLHEKFSASNWTRWIRESGATVTNLVGVMSDFLWKQPPARRRRRQQVALRVGGAEPDRRRRTSSRRGSASPSWSRISGSPRSPCRSSRRTAVPRPKGAAGLAVDRLVRHPAGRPRDRRGGARRARSVSWSCGPRCRGPPAPATSTCRTRPPRRCAICWFHTGDGLRRDAEGWYYFVDRLKDAIRRRGENISSYEVEQAMLGLDQVAECAVIGVPADGHVIGGRGDGRGRSRRRRLAGRRQAFWDYCEPAHAVLRRAPIRAVRRRAAQDTVGQDPEGAAACRGDRVRPRSSGSPSKSPMTSGALPGGPGFSLTSDELGARTLAELAASAEDLGYRYLFNAESVDFDGDRDRRGRDLGHLHVDRRHGDRERLLPHSVHARHGGGDPRGPVRWPVRPRYGRVVRRARRRCACARVRAAAEPDSPDGRCGPRAAARRIGERREAAPTTGAGASDRAGGSRSAHAAPSRRGRRRGAACAADAGLRRRRPFRDRAWRRH